MDTICTSRIPWACSIRLATSAPVMETGCSEYLSNRLFNTCWIIMLSTMTSIMIIQIIWVESIAVIFMGNPAKGGP